MQVNVCKAESCNRVPKTESASDMCSELRKGQESIGRRGFLKKATVTVGMISVPYIVPSSVLGLNGKIAPSEKITIGCVGMGQMGTSNMWELMGNRDTRIVAVCDVFDYQRDKAKNIVDKRYANKDCATYNDFRDLLARKDIDAVNIATTDNWHCLIAIAAAKAGKHIHLEKAMGLSLPEDIAVREAVHRYGVVFQFGTEDRSFAGNRRTCELVRNGRIGKLHTIKVGSPRSKPFPNQPTQPVPKGLDYEMWLGPAPWAPYTYHRCRPHNPKEGYGIWYHISDYCQGFVAGWGIHYIAIAQWGNGTDDTGPVEIEGSAEFPEDGLADCATSWKVNLKYDNGVTLVYGSNNLVKDGVLFEGTEGSAFVRYNSGVETNPPSLAKSVIGQDEIHLYKSPGHLRNFLDCIKSREETISPVDKAVRTDTVCHLTRLAYMLKRKLHWDPKQEQFINDDEANRMLIRLMRSPWRIP